MAVKQIMNIKDLFNRIIVCDTMKNSSLLDIVLDMKIIKNNDYNLCIIWFKLVQINKDMFVYQ